MWARYAFICCERLTLSHGWGTLCWGGGVRLSRPLLSEEGSKIRFRWGVVVYGLCGYTVKVLFVSREGFYYGCYHFCGGCSSVCASS